MKKRFLFNLIVAGMLLGNPVVMMPMEEVEVENERSCPVCFNDASENEFPRLQCGHNGACVYCLRDQLERGLGREWREVNRHLKCPQNGCQHVMGIADIRNVDSTKLVTYGDVMLQLIAGAVDGNVEFVNCPTQNCAGMYPVEANRGNVRCEVCNQTFCSKCQRLHDVDQQGNEIQDCFCSRCHTQHNSRQQCAAGAPINNNNNNNLTAEERRRLEQERQNQAWIQRNTKACPRCHVNIQKNDGCNHMTCRNADCGHHFCWVCLEPWAINRNHPTFYRCLGTPSHSSSFFASKNYTPIVIVGVVAVAAAASYGAYKLYKRFFPLKPAQEKSVHAHLEDLHKEAIKARKHMVSATGYAAGSFEAYFAAQVENHAYKALHAEKLTALRKIVDDLEKGLVAGSCDKQYAALVKFLLVADAPAQAEPKPVVVPRPVPVKQQPEKKRPAKQARAQAVQKRLSARAKAAAAVNNA